MQTLDLDIEHSIGPDCQAKRRLHVVREPLLVALLDGPPFLAELWNLGEVEEALELEARVDSIFEGVAGQSRGRSRSAASHTPIPAGRSRGVSTSGRGTRDTVSPAKRKADALNDEGEFVPEEIVDSPAVQAAREVVVLFEQLFPLWQGLLEVKDESDRSKALQRFDYGQSDPCGDCVSPLSRFRLH